MSIKNIEELQNAQLAHILWLKYTSPDLIKLLHMAIREKHNLLANYLIQTGIDINAKWHSLTPIELSIQINNLDMTEKILQYALTIKQKPIIKNISILTDLIKIKSSNSLLVKIITQTEIRRFPMHCDQSFVHTCFNFNNQDLLIELINYIPEKEEYNYLYDILPVAMKHSSVEIVQRLTKQYKSFNRVPNQARNYHIFLINNGKFIHNEATTLAILKPLFECFCNYFSHTKHSITFINEIYNPDINCPINPLNPEIDFFSFSYLKGYYQVCDLILHHYHHTQETICNNGYELCLWKNAAREYIDLFEQFDTYQDFILEIRPVPEIIEKSENCQPITSTPEIIEKV